VRTSLKKNFPSASGTPTVRIAPAPRRLRALAGVAPWVELGPDATPEGKLREKFGLLARSSLINAADPDSPDYLSFGNSSTVGRQALVEAAYLAHALLRAPKVLWEPLTEAQKQNVIASLKTTRHLKPVGAGSAKNNWLLFASMVEAALWHYTGDAQKNRLKYGLLKFRQWYLGDGTYGAGPHFIGTITMGTSSIPC
jgi:hypothetical protein